MGAVSLYVICFVFLVILSADTSSPYQYTAIHTHTQTHTYTIQAPVPSAAIVMMLVAYTTAFGSTGEQQVSLCWFVLLFLVFSVLLTLHLLHNATHTHTQPAGLGYLFAIDWLLDRLTTWCNIPGDLTVTAIVADKVSKNIDAKLNEEEIDHGDERKVDSATKEE